MFSSHLFFCLPLFLFPGIVPCTNFLLRPLDLPICPNNRNFLFSIKEAHTTNALLPSCILFPDTTIWLNRSRSGKTNSAIRDIQRRRVTKMGFHRLKGKLHQVVVPMLVCLVIVMSLNVYMRRNIYDTKEELLLNAAKELEKVVTFSWRSTLVQLQAKRALSHILEILEECNVDIPSDILDVMQNTAGDKTKKSVCPEKYLGTQADYPWFEKGRILTNCSGVRPFASVISILLNGFDYARESQLQVVLREIYATYPRLTVHLAVREKMIIPEEVKLNVLQLVLGQRPAASDVWNRLVATASTDYVLVGRRIERFQWYALLERMVRVVAELGVNAVGGSLRTPDGHWSMGCQQTRLRNYTLTYRDGYHMSTNSCAYCDYIPSPFVSRTSTLRAVKFKMVSPDTVFHDYFLRLSQRTQTGHVVSGFNVLRPREQRKCVTATPTMAPYGTGTFAKPCKICRWPAFVILVPRVIG